MTCNYNLVRVYHSNPHTLALHHRIMSLKPSRGLYLYLKVLSTALEDDLLTHDESNILKILASSLGVSPSDVGPAMDVAKGIDRSPFKDEEYDDHQIGDASTYQSALIAALDDEVISEDEWAMLNTLRGLLGIQPNEHALIEEAIRSMSASDEDGMRRIERLAHFITVCPYY